MAGHIPRKRFGQNFLVDRQVIADIVAAIRPAPGDTMIEIGPGLGALTMPLLDVLDHLHVVEIDRDIIARLRRTVPAERLTIHEGDALEFDFGSVGGGAAAVRIAGNLPYNISTPLLFHLARFAERTTDLHFMLQKEVVDRMVAEPGGSDYGRLSVMLQYRFHMEAVLDVPPESFDPPPKVDSAVVRMIPKAASELPTVDASRFESLVAAAFSQRRKMVRNTLKAQFSEAQLSALGIDPTARAEELPLAAFVRLAQA